ncbi:RNA-directed DNA polymerase, eukaryota [Tanacetum coccineum]
MNNHNRSFHHSNESQTQKISSSVYVTNFPDSTSSRDLWKVCSDYGTVVDVFIPFKKSKAGKKFAFVRFIKVIDLERLVENLNTVWIGRFHLYANRVRFERPAKPVVEWSHKPCPNLHSAKSAVSSSSFASVLKERYDPAMNSEPVLVLDESCLKAHEFNLSLMGKVKNVSTIPNLPILIGKEGFQNVNLDYLGGMWVLFRFELKSTYDKFLAHTGVESWFSTIKQADNSFVNDERIVWISVEGLPIKAWTPNSFKKIASCWGELVEWDDPDPGHNSFSCKHLCLKTRMNVIINDKRKILVQGKAFWIRVKELDAWFPDFEEDTDEDISSEDDEPKADSKIRGDKLVEDSDDEVISETNFGVNSASSNADFSSVKEAEYQSEDPFGIYPLLNKDPKGVNVDVNSSLSHPPGFTPEGSKQENDHIVVPEEENVTYSIPDKENLSHVHPNFMQKAQVVSDNESNSRTHTFNHSHKAPSGGSILEILDGMIRVGQSMGYKIIDGVYEEKKTIEPVSFVCKELCVPTSEDSLLEKC